MLIPFTKAHGTGNSFIIIYLENIITQPAHDWCTDKVIIKLCKQNNTDGLLILRDDLNYDFRMDYYNNDGSWETMCANGARCAGLFLYEKGIINKHATFITGDGDHQIKILDTENVELTISSPKYASDKINMENGLSGFSINSGAKHFVVEVDINDNLNWEKIGREIRNLNYFSPNGTNVNFVKKISKNILSVITYEKGVEAIMQSCGSGSVAAAYHMHKKYNLDNDITIQVPGGELFITSDSNWKEVWLKGPAKILSHQDIDTKEIINE